MEDKEWKVFLSTRARKQLRKVPYEVFNKAAALTLMLSDGPLQPTWPNFGPLVNQKLTYHCHLKRGRPTYVTCWRVIDKNEREIEVYYVGTHEDAPY